MSRRRIIDTHVHLWPAEACNEEGHAWMTPGNPLAKPHLLEHYSKASQQDKDNDLDFEVEGIVYVETDVRYDDPDSGAGVATWAKGPLNEISFLRTIVEGEHGQWASHILCGIIAWAPMNQPVSVLREYLRLVSERAGTDSWPLWGRLVGFRYLLQFITDPKEFEELVLGQNFIGNLKELGTRGLIFEIGVDQRSGGTFQLEVMARAMQKAREGVPEEQQVTFVCNHLCKPAFGDTGTAFDEWCEAISVMAKLPRTYMKLSGAFSELPAALSTDPMDIAKYLQPWIKHVLQCFGAERIIFGSDWPVCNVNGPGGEESWISWKSVVDSLISSPVYGLSEEDQDCIWRGTAQGVYRLKINL